MKIAIVSAHRGDAAYGVGLSMGAWLAAGHSVEVIACCTRSEFAPFSDANSLHANDRMSFVTAVRKREDEAWLKLYPSAPGRGKLTLTDLNLKDAPLRLHVEPAEVFGLEVDAAEKAFAKIQKAVERSKAQALVVPFALDGHIDRLTARAAALAAVTGETPVAFYEDLPQAAMAVDGILIEQALGSAAMPLTAVRARVPLVDDAVTVVVTRKRRVAWCYDSQIDEATTALIADRCRDYAGREGLWGNAAWVASPLNSAS